MWAQLSERSALTLANVKIIGAAEGVIIATIITAHMKKIISAYGTDQPTALGEMRLETSVRMP
ncbi:MAG: hypothetical protein OEZ04_04540 [Nitrospinota bacterium]|nr:hypothetical protein [Nitrospinota bacterium]